MIKLTKERVRQAFNKAESDEAKGILESLFPDIAKELTKKKPTLDDYTSITSYEDACEALGESPIFSSDYVRSLDGKEGEVEFYIYGCEKANTEWQTMIVRLPCNIIALMKLETISKALWGRNWEPKPDVKGDKIFYWPWFALLTAEEINDMLGKREAVLLASCADSVENARFGALYACGRASSSYASASLGFYLCQETEEKARYFGGRNFVKLWAEYLQSTLLLLKS